MGKTNLPAEKRWGKPFISDGRKKKKKRSHCYSISLSLFWVGIIWNYFKACSSLFLVVLHSSQRKLASVVPCFDHHGRLLLQLPPFFLFKEGQFVYTAPKALGNPSVDPAFRRISKILRLAIRPHFEVTSTRPPQISAMSVAHCGLIS